MKKLIYSLMGLALLSGCNQDNVSYNKAVRVKTLGATMVYSDRVTLAGSVDSQNDITISEVGFLLDTVYIDPATFDRTRVIVADMSSSLFTALAPDMIPAKQYYVVAFARDSKGGMYYGGQVSLRTGVPLATAISAPAAGNLTIRSADLSAKLDEDSGVPIAWIGVKYWPDGGNEADAVFDSIPGFPLNEIIKGNRFSVKVDGLTPSTLYNYVMYARNDRKGVWATAGTFSTLECNPATVVTVTPQGDYAAPTSLSITCNFTNNGNDPATVVGLAYKKDGLVTEIPDPDTWTLLEAATIESDGSYTILIDDLEPNTSLVVAAYALNFAGYSYGDVIEVATMELTAPVFELINYGLNDFDKDNLPGITTGEKPVGKDYIWMRANLTAANGHMFDVAEFVYADNAAFTSPQTITATYDPAIKIYSAKLSGLTATDPKRFFFKLRLHSVYQEEFFSSVGTQKQAIAVKKNNDQLYMYKGGTTVVSALPYSWEENTNNPIAYYELPPIRITEIADDGNDYNYYFLDRNLGAIKAPGAEQFDRTIMDNNSSTLLNNSNKDEDYFGYWYFYSLAAPVTLATQTNNPGGSAIGDNGNWVGWLTFRPVVSEWEPANDPCPKGYRLPTRKELDYMRAKYDNNYIDFRHALNAMWPLRRNNNNGAIQAPRNSGGQQGYLAREGYYEVTGNTNTATWVWFSSTFSVDIAAFPARCMTKEPAQ
ncbi:hypothetical protein FACS1894159_04330 [Bacteroidia bacterium]|nr:hypothetical protein FACS1894159_04330 [Bacteroidia bacterium]